MSKTKQQKAEQRKAIREQFLADLCTKEGSEYGISIFDEKVHKPKVFRTEIKVPMERIKPTQTSKAKVDVRAVNQRKPKTFKSSMNITLKKPAQPKTIAQRRPTRTAPKVPEGVKPWRPCNTKTKDSVTKDKTNSPTKDEET